ncbi:MAG TPA: OmpA family protein [Kofleriaceae bacterium]|nr:OmpA family protein [Kofleriaceae bacterium]
MTRSILIRPTTVAALAASGMMATAGVAHANVEIGGTAGIHVFSDKNELGVNDVPNADSERNSVLFGARLGVYFGPVIGVEGEFGGIPSESRQQVFDLWNITYRGHVVVQFRAWDDTAHFIPFVLFGGGAMQIVSNGGHQNDTQIAKDTDAELYVGVGAKYRLDNGWGIRVDGRLLFPPSSEDKGFTEDFEALLSIYKEFGRHKAPPPAVDNDPDHDGILGDADKCPNDAEDKDGFQDEDGCPDLDNDGDGVPDSADKCPNEPEDKDGFQDEDGCPDPDNDSDGIPDAVDKCPNEAEDKDGFQDEDGCPDPDNDNDGVPDAQDKCPNEPETKNGFQDEDGCPDEIPAKLKQFTGVIQGINFKLGDSSLQTSSNPVLDKAVAVLKEFGDLKLEIQGHTDDVPVKKGSKFPDNKALSQARAETVKAYFVSKGIDEGRLTATGYGDSQPLVEMKDLKGAKLNAARAKNRRVEFKLVSNLTASPAAPATPPAAPATPPAAPAPANPPH